MQREKSAMQPQQISNHTPTPPQKLPERVNKGNKEDSKNALHD